MPFKLLILLFSAFLFADGLVAEVKAQTLLPTRSSLSQGNDDTKEVPAKVSETEEAANAEAAPEATPSPPAEEAAAHATQEDAADSRSQPMEILPSTAAAPTKDSPIVVTREQSPTLNEIGLHTPEALGLPASLWTQVSTDDAKDALAAVAIPHPIPVLGDLVTRLLLASGENNSNETELFFLRLDTLVNSGRFQHAFLLLKRVPKSLKNAELEKMLFLFERIKTPQTEGLCSDVVAKLASTADPFWQQWLILCQARDSKKDKASLGIELLREQGALGDFFVQLVDSTTGQNPLRTVPESLTIEAIAWLRFLEQEKLLFSQESPSAMLLGALYSSEPEKTRKTWSDKLRQLRIDEAIEENSLSPISHPDLQSNIPALTLREETADWPYYFALGGLRHALDLPWEPLWDTEMLGRSFPQHSMQLYPLWNKAIEEMFRQGKSGLAILKISRIFNAPLASYNITDIITLVSLLQQAGMTQDAYALAAATLKEAKKQVGKQKPHKAEKKKEEN